MNNLVSICCLAYNHEKYIRKTLEGFINQKTTFDIEVLVHDDASTDGTADIIREYEERYPDIIKPIYQTENQYSKGIKMTWKYQYPRVRGKYIALCEGDDYWSDEGKLQKQYDAMEKNPNCSISTHKVSYMYEDGKISTKIRPKDNISPGLIKKEDVIKYFMETELYPFQTSCYFIRTELIDLILQSKLPAFIENSKVGDLPLMLYLCAKGDLFYIGDTMSCYRMNSVGSATQRLNKNAKKIPLYYKNYIDILNEYNKYTEYKYDQYIQEGIKHIEFCIFQYYFDIKKMRDKKYKRIFKSMPLKKQIYYNISGALPFAGNFYRYLRRKIL